MKIFMIGGTGLLGCEAATELIKMGHEVKSVGLPGLTPKDAPIPKEMELIEMDINKASDEEVENLLKGCDTFIFAAGVDERKECPPPVAEVYKKFNNDPLQRLIPICKKVGIKNAVVCGSYFSYMYKLAAGLAKNPANPKQKIKYTGEAFLAQNPYIKSRIEQEKIVESFCDDTFSASVLELPYIFGVQPGRRPVWTILIDQLKRMDNLPFTMYPAGGTAMLTCNQVGQALAGAAVQKPGYGFRAIPIGMYNLTWKEFLAIVYDARGMHGRKVVSIAPWMMKLGMKSVQKDYEARNIESGMDPFQLPYTMDYNLFIDPTETKALGVKEADIKKAIFDSIDLSIKAVNGTAKLVGMEGEAKK